MTPERAFMEWLDRENVRIIGATPSMVMAGVKWAVASSDPIPKGAEMTDKIDVGSLVKDTEREEELFKIVRSVETIYTVVCRCGKGLTSNYSTTQAYNTWLRHVKERHPELITS